MSVTRYFTPLKKFLKKCKKTIAQVYSKCKNINEISAGGENMDREDDFRISIGEISIEW